MSSLIFIPELCFTASCRWQLADYADRPAVWAEGDPLSRPIWTEFDDWNGEDGWLMANRNYHETEFQSFLVDNLPGFDPRKSLSVDTFWFGAYRHAYGYAYEIRPAYEGRHSHRWPELNYWLDISRNGYLGFYSTDVAAGTLASSDAHVDFKDPVGVLPTVSLPVDLPIDLDTPLYHLLKGRHTPLWHIAGLDPENLAEGGLHLDLALYGHNGRRVRRLMENGRGYLNAGRGRPGVLLMCISNPCVPPLPQSQED